MKLGSRDVYAGLREVLSPVARAAGFKRGKSGMLAWTRPEGARHVTFWFQCDKNGWFDDFGSRFTLEFQLADVPDAAAGGWNGRLRFWQLLSAEELESVRAINNEILRALPEPGPNNVVNLLPPDAREWFRSSYQPVLQPYNPNHDVWLHYFTPRDVARWAGFFRERLTALVDVFLSHVAAGGESSPSA